MTEEGNNSNMEYEDRSRLRGKEAQLRSLCDSLTDALKKSEDRLKEAQQNAHIGNWEWWPQAGELLWSDENYRIFGIPLETPPSMELFYAAVHPDDISRVKAAIEEALTSNKPCNLDMRIVHRNGEERFVDARAEVERDGSGKAVRMHGTFQDITDRKKMENMFLSSQSRYREIIDSQTEFVVRYQPGGIITFVNDTLCRYTNMERKDLLEKSYYPFMHPDDRSEFVRKIEELDRNAPVMVAEARVVLPDGRVSWHRWTHQAIFDDLGELMEYQATGRDITELKRAEEEIAERGAMLQQILDAASVAIFLVDRTGRIAHANMRMTEMFGSPMEELIGSEYVEHVHPSEREVGKQKMLALLASEIPSVDLERYYWRKDGTEFWGHLVGRRFHDVHGNDLGLIGVITDISERKKAEERLLTSEKRFRTIVERAAGGILVADAETKKFRFANPELCRMLGYSREELLALSVPDIHPAEEMQAVAEGFDRQLAETLLDVETFCLRKDGSLIPVSIRSTPLEMDGRQCLMGFFTDMTERHLLEEERMKTEKLEATGLLAGGIAHDFNNLLQGIFGYIAMAKMNIDEKERVLDMLEQAEKALHLSVNLTTQLLTFSKGGKPLKKPLRLKPVIENAVKFALSGSRTDYRLDAEDDLLHVEADEGQLAQVIQNIVLNADQAMPLGGTVEVTARNVAPPASMPTGLSGKARYIVITIRDSGIGIPKQYLSSIFDPYFTTKEKGSGIGLATSYSIIRNHGGLIDVQSEVGKGTTFFIYLPGLELEEEVPAVPQLQAGARPGRVLVMDDDELLRTVAGEMIRTLGHEVVCVPDGEAAIEQYRSAMESGNPFDVVILDLTVRGGMGGQEAMSKLLAFAPGIRAIVSSGYSENAVMSEYREHGFRACLGKPYRFEELREALNSLLG